jgi:hypothetical protein
MLMGLPAFVMPDCLPFQHSRGAPATKAAGAGAARNPPADRRDVSDLPQCTFNGIKDIA